MNRTYTVRSINPDEATRSHVTLDDALVVFEEAWDDADRGALIVDDLDGQPACLTSLKLGCGCGRCDTARFVTEEAPESFTFDELVACNQDSPLDDEDLEAIRGLDVGESVTIGGGAGGTTTFTRVPNSEPCPPTTRTGTAPPARSAS